jgi:hypothetical protein
MEKIARIAEAWAAAGKADIRIVSIQADRATSGPLALTRLAQQGNPGEQNDKNETRRPEGE